MRTALCDIVLEQAVAAPAARAVTYQDASLSYAELADEVHRFGTGLLDLGITRGDRIAVYLEKRIETVVAIFGASAAAAAFVPINPVLKPRQVAFILRDSAAAVLVTSRARLKGLQEHGEDLSTLRRVILVDDDAEESPTTAPWHALGRSRGGTPARTIDADLGAILYTSGSTGTPKGVALTHRNLLVGAESVNAYLPNTPDDVILAVLPLSFDAGLSQLTTGFDAGAHVVLMNYLLPRDVMRLCERHGVTAMTCVPPLWIQLADQDWGERGSTVRYFANTGGRMPRVTLDRLRHHFSRATPYLMYGLTEAFRSTYLDPAQVDTRPDSIGKAIPNADVLVVRPDGSPCAPGEQGELVHRGALVARGYWNDPERTAERFRPFPSGREGWASPEIAVWSGDLAYSDEEGFLYFVGRADDMIKTSGYRVSPTEVEECAMSTGLVRDAVAIGVEDPVLGQRIELVVAGSGGPVDADGLLATLRRELPSYMVPARIDVRDEIPRGANGKYDRAVLRAELSEVRS